MLGRSGLRRIQAASRETAAGHTVRRVRRPIRRDGLRRREWHRYCIFVGPGAPSVAGWCFHTFGNFVWKGREFQGVGWRNRCRGAEVRYCEAGSIELNQPHAMLGRSGLRQIQAASRETALGHNVRRVRRPIRRNGLRRREWHRYCIFVRWHGAQEEIKQSFSRA